jgi:hypothetical protein
VPQQLLDPLSGDRDIELVLAVHALVNVPGVELELVAPVLQEDLRLLVSDVLDGLDGRRVPSAVEHYAVSVVLVWHVRSLSWFMKSNRSVVADRLSAHWCASPPTADID